jgi:PIN domain nuclease of toxin-antitoxin system
MNLYLKHFGQNWHEIMLDTHDRLVIAQANTENAVLISCDSVFADYPVSLLW